MIVVLLIAFIGFAAFFFLYFSARREINRLDEERQMILQEKQIVVDFMHDLVEALGEDPSRDELFQRIVHAAILSTGALSACVFEKTENNRLRGVAIEGLFPPHRPLPEASKIKLTTRAKFIEQVLKSEEFDIGDGIAGAVAQTGKAILVEDAVNDPRVVKHDDPALMVKSLVAAPIVFKDRFIGVLCVVNPADGLPFNQTDLSLVQSLAEQAGLAIHNSDLLDLQMEKRKMDLDLSLASGIQQMLMPKNFPQLGDLDIDASYIPAQKVGGDLYDLFQLSDSTLGVVVADVSGKGVPASLLMAICRSNLRHFSKQYDSPARVLIELNRSMAPEMRRDMFITLIYAVVDPVNGRITFARAGHELPIHCHEDSVSGVFTSEQVGSEGMAVGMVDGELFDAVLQDHQIQFAKGDSFLLYTDGVTEAANIDGVEFSNSRLADVVKTLRRRNARELNRGVLESVERFSGKREFADDFTLVTVKRS